MLMSGMDFIQNEIAKLVLNICPTCLAPLPPREKRVREFTCNEKCHAKWIDDIVFRLGETRNITHLKTGKIYAVPTRVILESGVSGAELIKYPEVIHRD